MSKNHKYKTCSSSQLAVLSLTALATVLPLEAKGPPANPSTGAPPPGQAKKAKTYRLEDATIPQIQEAMAGGALTSVELVSLYLRRIQAYDKTSITSPNQPLNSVAALNPDLLDDAAKADQLRKEGVVLGPLHGIPFLVKWSYPIKDMALTGGINGWKDLVTTNEAWCVTRMREAGGIAMGHANMDSWAASASNSTSQIKGSVRSAYLQGALPGGSSGGSGVSSGAYLTNFAFGGETGGSIRHPSDRNGLVGYKVSGGSVSVNRIIPLAPDRDVIGPMTRNAGDNAIIRDIVGVVDPNDLWAPVHPYLTKVRPVPETGFVSAVSGATLAGKKIGIIGTYVGKINPDSLPTDTVETRGVQTPTPATTTLVEKMKLDMEGAGAVVEYVYLPREVSTTWPLPPGSPRLMLDRIGPLYNNSLSAVHRSVIQSVVAQPGDSYQDIAVKVLQTATLASPFISTTVRNMMYTLDPATQLYGPGTAIGFDSPEGYEHFSARALHHAAFEKWMDEEGLDAVVWPTFVNKTRTGGSTIGRDLANIMNLPSVTVPMGVLTQPATTTTMLPEGNEPLTLNITGRFYDDQKILGIASAYEQATKHRYAPTLAPPLAGEEFKSERFLTGTAKKDSLPPVLSIAPAAQQGEADAIFFTGTVADAGGVDRLEVSVGGALIPAVVTGNTWKAVLPAEAAANAVFANATVIDAIVLAVDTAGNASCVTEDITL